MRYRSDDAIVLYRHGSSQNFKHMGDRLSPKQISFSLVP